MIIAIGEILIDRFPDYERIGGAPFNFAYHLKNMGWPVRLITRIGDDEDGRSIRQLLETSGFDLKDVQVDQNHATGRVNVTLDGKGVPQFDICENAAYDHIDLSAVWTDDGATDMAYFGTLVQRSREGFEHVHQFLERQADNTTCFCDINLRPPHILPQAIDSSLRHADILKLNEEELLSISSLCKGPARADEIVPWLMQSYQISKIALTRGEEGSAIVTDQGTVNAERKTAAHLVDTVGAGDAYASVIAAGTLNRLPAEQILNLASEFAGLVCGIPGAIPDNRHFYSTLQQDFERIRNAQ